MDFADVRRIVIIAMFADDTLFNQLVLKGGNALNLIYGIGDRSSLDVDLSPQKPQIFRRSGHGRSGIRAWRLST